MNHIGVIRKDPDSDFGVSFPGDAQITASRRDRHPGAPDCAARHAIGGALLLLLAACTSGMGSCREQYPAGSTALENCYSAELARENARLNHQAEEELNAPGF